MKNDLIEDYNKYDYVHKIKIEALTESKKGTKVIFFERYIAIDEFEQLFYKWFRNE